MPRCHSCDGQMRAVYYCEDADCPNQNPLTADMQELNNAVYGHDGYLKQIERLTAQIIDLEQQVEDWEKGYNDTQEQP